MATGDCNEIRQKYHFFGFHAPFWEGREERAGRVAQRDNVSNHPRPLPRPTLKTIDPNLLKKTNALEELQRAGFLAG
jgi:hypothetical protein